jgi:hypothetical protein
MKENHYAQQQTIAPDPPNSTHSGKLTLLIVVLLDSYFATYIVWFGLVVIISLNTT